MKQPVTLNFFKRSLITAILAIAAAPILFSQTTQVFTSSGTFTVPACVSSITVQCWGAGGGGGSADEAGGGACGSGGGGGGFASATISNPSGSYTVVVGTGGTGGVGTSSLAPDGSAGGNSIFTNGTDSVIAYGGGAGIGSTGGVASTVGAGGGGAVVGWFVGAIYTGGNGAQGNNAHDNIGGGGGGGAGNAGNGATPANASRDTYENGGTGGAGSPATAQYQGGVGGSVAAAFYENGGNGSTIGGGGGGGGGENQTFHGTYPGNGGSGGNGQVIIAYTLSTPAINLVTGSGCAGSLIAIHGSLLAGASAVTIGGTAIGSLTISDSLITGVLTTGCTTGTVAVVTSCGTATSAAPFMVYPLPANVILYDTIIRGDTVFIGTAAYTQSGTFTDTLSSVHGCDSALTLHLYTYVPSVYTTLYDTICQGNTVHIGSHNYSNTGSYTDSLASAQGGDSIVSLHLMVLPVDSPSVSISIGRGPATGGMQTDTFHALSNHCAAPFYTWYQNGVPLSMYDSIAVVTLSASKPDSIWCTVQCGNRCLSSPAVSSNTITITGISSIPGISGIRVFPNPSNGKFEVEIAAEDGVEKEGEIIVLDMEGRVLQSDKLSLHIGTNNQIINLGRAEPGLYLMGLKLGSSAVYVSLSIAR